MWTSNLNILQKHKFVETRAGHCSASGGAEEAAGGVLYKRNHLYCSAQALGHFNMERNESQRQ